MKKLALLALIGSVTAANAGVFSTTVLEGDDGGGTVAFDTGNGNVNEYPDTYIANLDTNLGGGYSAPVVPSIYSMSWNSSFNTGGVKYTSVTAYLWLTITDLTTGTVDVDLSDLVLDGGGFANGSGVTSASFNSNGTSWVSVTVPFTTSTGVGQNQITSVVIKNLSDGTVSPYAMALNYTPEAVPEPASMAALAIGGLGLLRRRSNSK
ncbi:MAG: PEP-CTERM sorting domain-containing protein [Fimbriimonas sp.]